MKGTVKNWLDGRGFGFIDSEELQEDVFVHYSELNGAYNLNRGQQVEFEVEDTHRGLRALDVQLVE